MPPLKVGVFSFAGDEGCVIELVELLNTYYEVWKGKVEFKYARILRKNNDMTGLDVAFVEGAIASEDDVKKIKEIRANCKKLVCIGSCAILAQPAGQRNLFDEKTKSEVQFLVERFHQLPRVLKVSEVVKTDYDVPGCPMMTDKFVEVMNTLLAEFNVV
jgi:coenzyme F420-reducing hydrogenase gamma subunit